MQDWLCITAGLVNSLENQVTCGLKSDIPVKILGHWVVQRIAVVLIVYYTGHALHGAHHLFLVANTVTEPISYMLTGYSQGGSVFH